MAKKSNRQKRDPERINNMRNQCIEILIGDSSQKNKSIDELAGLLGIDFSTLQCPSTEKLGDHDV